MRVLIFGTTYTDTMEKVEIEDKWINLHRTLNPTCDLMLVDSASPLRSVARTDDVHVLQLNNNIGHLGRSGRDGWGRAFCAGLQYAVENYYDFVVHVEGDSLLRQPVMPFCECMKDNELESFVCGVNGTKFKEFRWVETGMMFMSVPYVQESNFIERYNWQDGASKKYPHTPEAVVYEMLEQDDALSVVPLNVMRDDQHLMTKDNIGEYDWITHTTTEIFSTFVTSSTVPA